MTRASGKHRHEEGSALTEFALAAATVLLVVFLIVDAGRALYAYDWISDAARHATRFAMVRGTMCDPLLASYCAVASQPRGAQSADITTYVDSLATAIDTSQVTVSSHCFASGTVAGNPPCAPNAWVQVKVSYNFQFLSPLFPLSWTMHSTSERAVQQ
ncbi:MAG TPA: TadE family protein [Terriglobales bacterium]|nr:TadE family protein [Terriglobales bacterium]